MRNQHLKSHAIREGAKIPTGCPRHPEEKRGRIQIGPKGAPRRPKEKRGGTKMANRVPEAPEEKRGGTHMRRHQRPCATDKQKARKRRRQTAPMHSRHRKSCFFYILRKLCVTAIHLPNIHFENVISTLGGGHTFQNKQKNLRRRSSPPENSF